MMFTNQRKTALGFFFLLAFATICFSTRQAGAGNGATRSQFQGTDDWLPGGDPGQIRCAPGQFSGDFLQPCPPGSNLFIRGAAGQSRADGDDPRLTGILSFTVNGNLDSAYTGPVWGTWAMEADCGGFWEGVWHGSRTLIPDQPGPLGVGVWIGRLRLVGHGREGCAEGLLMRAEETVTTFTPIPLAYELLFPCQSSPCPPEGVISGSILEPGHGWHRPDGYNPERD